MLKRKFEIKIRFTEDELLMLNAKARSCKMNREEYCRTVLGGSMPTEAPSAEFYQFIHELRRIGANINQLLKVAHTKGFIDAPLLRKTLDNYRSTERMIWDKFGEHRE